VPGAQHAGGPRLGPVSPRATSQGALPDSAPESLSCIGWLPAS
jgi:hypothetical protein